ncbi:Nucleoporin NUP49 [Cytospora mali]|uniref:Nucleoporin NUP49 n=1 Tax=Cytospora mali TaxID=578113 RepID=A0A194USI3_CYTMA|nr:Nucleoporin NUP49 [Valsa mali var. pyri (nom. inval.)]
MAFARSASGPAGLSINTGAANSFGNSSSQPPLGGSLFGSASTTAQPSTQTNSLFGGGNTTNSQPAQTPSMFGNTQNQQQGGGLLGSNAASKPGGLFGSNTATTGTGGGGGLFGNASQPQQTSGGLFGASTATSQQPAQSGGLFGAATNNTAQPQQTGGLFGQSTAAPQPAQTGGLFGQSTQQQQPASTGGGLFGNAQKPAGSLFGGGNANTTTGTGTTGGLFGGQSNTGTSGGLFSGLNQSTAQQPSTNPTLGSTMNQQGIPGVRIDLSNLKSTTRFNDLQEDLQKQIADIDKFIQGCVAQKDQLDAFMPAHGEQLSAIPGDVRFVSRKYAAVDSALGSDLHAIKQMRDLVKSDAEEASLSFSAVNNLMLPSDYHNKPNFFSPSNRDGSGSAKDGDGEKSDLVSYFSKQVDDMNEQIKRFQKNVHEIETHLGGVEHNINDQASRLQHGAGGLGTGSAEDKQMELYAVLRDFEESILQVAGVVGSAREGITELQLNDFRGRGINGVH